MFFYDSALKDLINLVDDAIYNYKQIYPNTSFIGRELEDKAMREFDLPDISNVLDSIIERVDLIRNLQSIVESQTNVSSEVFLPPEKKFIISGNGEGMKEKQVIPRLLTLLYILENDLQLPLEKMKKDDDGHEQNIFITQGAVKNEMMRKLPYFCVEILPLNRVVYICDEEGNASYVFDIEELNKLNITIPDLDTSYKTDFKELINANPTIGKRIIQNSNWREEVFLSLTEPFNRQTEQQVLQQRKSRSDFDSKEEIPLKKEGWRSRRSLSDELKVDCLTIDAFAEPYRETHPEWFEVQRPAGRGGPSSEHYHPDLVAIIREHFKNKK